MPKLSHENVLQLLDVVRAEHNVIQRAKRAYGERLAPDFTPFEFIRRDELSLSRLLGWLLDPNGSHGQRGAFLRLFTRQLGDEWTARECEASRVQLELPIADDRTDINGRLDIRVHSHRRELVIENKPDARDQKHQLQRYFDYLDMRVGSESKLIYLTRDGSRPTANSISEEEAQERLDSSQLHCWSYPVQILEWLRECRSECRADRVGMFIDEFTRFITSHFGGVDDMTEQDQIVAAIIDNPESVSSAIQLLAAGPSIMEGLKQRLKAQLEEAVHNEGWRLDWHVQPKSWAYLAIDYAKGYPFEFRCEWTENDYNGFSFGIYRDDPNATSDEGIAKALRAELGPSGNDNSGHWLWWNWAGEHPDILRVDRDWRNRPDNWAWISNGDMAKAIINGARAVERAIASVAVGRS